MADDFNIDPLDEIVPQLKIKRSIEGESVDNLDDLDIENKSHISDIRINISFVTNLPRMPCFREFDISETLIHHGEMKQVDSLLFKTAKKRYAILLKSKLVIFKKAEENVSKLQIPINCIRNLSLDDSNHEFKFETPVNNRTLRFQTQSAKIWYDHINSLPKEMIDIKYTLKEKAFLKDVKENRYFVLEHTFISYFESEKHLEYNIAMHRINLRTINVAKDKDNAGLIIKTPYRQYVLIFSSSTIRDEWLAAITHKINEVIIQPSPRPSNDLVEKNIYLNDSNQKCAECAKDKPKWVSINWFITLCNECAGLHRGLYNYSKVRSIDKDISVWEDDKLVKLFIEIGNETANKFWLHNFNTKIEKITHEYLKNKYIRKEYIPRPNQLQYSLNEGLLNAIKNGDLNDVMIYYHSGADLGQDHSKLKNIIISNKCLNSDLILKFLSLQVIRLKDWRVEFFRKYKIQSNDIVIMDRNLSVIINDNPIEKIKFKMLNYCFQIIRDYEVINIDIENVSSISRRFCNDTEALIIILKDTVLINQTVLNSIKIVNNEYMTQISDLDDIKNVFAQQMCPIFTPECKFQYVSWVVISTVETNWHPYFLIIQDHNLKFIDPINEIDNKDIVVNIRKIQRIEEQKIDIVEKSCEYSAYNLQSISLIMPNIIYHIRSDSKDAHKELKTSLEVCWNTRDNSLQNQILNNNSIPLAVMKMCDYLQNNCTIIDGPFRRAGRKLEAEKIYNELINNPQNYIFRDQDPYDVTTAFKLYFRKLSDPLLTKKLFKKWLAAVKISDFNEKMETFKELLNQLPVVNYQTLRKIIFLFVDIVESPETKLISDTLSTSFNDCLLISENSSFNAFDNEILRILPFLINNYIKLFDVSEEELERERIIREVTSNTHKQPQQTLLRHIHFEIELKDYLKEQSFDKFTWLDDTKQDFYKQIPISKNWTVVDLKNEFFLSNDIWNSIHLFEERKIEDQLMEILIYPPEKIDDVIALSSEIESRLKNQNNNNQTRFIFKLRRDINLIIEKNDYNFEVKLKRCRVEISDTNQLNIWRNNDIIDSFPIKSLTLYRTFHVRNYAIAIGIWRNGDEKKSDRLMKQLNFFNKTRVFTTIPFNILNEFKQFLKLYDQAKIFELTPIQDRPGIARRT